MPASSPVLVIMGVSGSGKSTVARALVTRLGWDFEEGDDLHSAASVTKMAGGTPLGDDDRAPWLDAVAAWIRAQQHAGRPGVITCSALRRRYRDVLRGPGVTFVLLDAPATVLADRLERRAGHFMPPKLLVSQLATLEPPAADEDAITVDATDDVDAQAVAVITALGLSRGERTSATRRSRPGADSQAPPA